MGWGKEEQKTRGNERVLGKEIRMRGMIELEPIVGFGPGVFRSRLTSHSRLVCCPTSATTEKEDGVREVYEWEVPGSVGKLMRRKIAAV